ncbi:hypothetical protein PGB90_004693 [Kerria lacca]
MAQSSGASFTKSAGILSYLYTTVGGICFPIALLPTKVVMFSFSLIKLSDMTHCSDLGANP